MDSRAERLAQKARPLGGNRHCKVLPGCARETTFLEIPAAGDEKVPLYDGKLFHAESRLDVMGEREVDVVASEQQVIADGDALYVRKR